MSATVCALFEVYEFLGCGSKERARSAAPLTKHLLLPLSFSHFFSKREREKDKKEHAREQKTYVSHPEMPEPLRRWLNEEDGKKHAKPENETDCKKDKTISHFALSTSFCLHHTTS